MLRIFTASSILAMAAVPAIAQQADPMAMPPAPEAPATTVTPTPAPTPQPMPADPAAPAPMAQTAPAAPTPETRETTVQKLVDAEFPSYDGDDDGELTQAEFSKWVLALQSASADASAQAMDDAAKAKWAKDAFVTADKDKNKKVNKAELNTFLLG